MRLSLLALSLLFAFGSVALAEDIRPAEDDLQLDIAPLSEGDLCRIQGKVTRFIADIDAAPRDEKTGEYPIMRITVQLLKRALIRREEGTEARCNQVNPLTESQEYITFTPLIKGADVRVGDIITAHSSLQYGDNVLHYIHPKISQKNGVIND